MERRRFLKNIFFATVGGSILAKNSFANKVTVEGQAKIKSSSTPKNTFTLWQLPSQSGGQMNSYVIKTVNGKVIVIDGGYDKDADYLKGFLAALGNEVDVWFISHQHIDHVGALTEILKNPSDLKMGAIYGSLLDESWIDTNESGSLQTAVKLNRALGHAKKQAIELALGQIIKIDGMTIEILGIKNPEITANGINNSSIVMRVWDNHKSVLFLNDLGVEGGKKLLQGKFGASLKSDYVQMAHHGQNGVDKDVYKAVGAKYCIWPTPLWLWDNNNGKGKGTGPWVTLEVREWMDKLGAEKHYCLFNGLERIQ